MIESLSPTLLMELHFLLPLLFTFLVFLFSFLRYVKGSKAITKLPPGPWKLPVIGSLHHLLIGGALPHRLLRDLAKKHGPIMHLLLGEVSTIVISSPEPATEVMKTHDLIFASRPEIMLTKILSYNSTNIAFAPYGDYWRQLRKICVMELLSVKRVQSYKSIREEEVKNLVKSISSISPGLPVNLTEQISSLNNRIVCRAVFGNYSDDKAEMVKMIHRAAKLASGFDVPDLFPSLTFLHSISRTKPALEKLHREMDKLFDGIINEHRQKRINNERSERDDLLDVLLKLQESGDLEIPLTANNIKAILLDVFGAGIESTATTMEWAMSEMMRKPRVMEKAQAEVRQVLGGKSEIEETDIQELNYLKSIIKETVRMHPAFPLLLPREARERCEINGYQIPMKTKVIINAWAIGRDPKHWNDPECFEPERFDKSPIDFGGGNFELIPFGAGRRMCPGVSFAMANIELAVAQLLYHFNWKLPDEIKPQELDMTESFGITAGRLNNLYLTAIPFMSFSDA